MEYVEAFGFGLAVLAMVLGWTAFFVALRYWMREEDA